MATAWCAMLPPAPALFSTTTVWPRFSESFFAMMRAAVSVAPPGANPTSMVTVRVGKSDWAAAAPANASAAMAARRLFMGLSSGLLSVGRTQYTIVYKGPPKSIRVYSFHEREAQGESLPCARSQGEAGGAARVHGGRGLRG